MPPETAPEPTLDELLHLGQIGLEQGLWDDAARYYQQALALQPNNVRALVGMAWAVRDPQQGHVWASRAHALAPEDPYVQRVMRRLAAEQEAEVAGGAEVSSTRRWRPWRLALTLVLLTALVGILWRTGILTGEPRPFMVATTIPPYAQTALASPTSTATEEISDMGRAQRATTLILAPVTGADQVSRGSGAVVDSAGLVLSSLHVLEVEPGVYVNDQAAALVGLSASPEKEPDAWYVGVVIARDVGRDLALLRLMTDEQGHGVVPGEFETIAWGDAATLSPGQAIVGLGYPALGGDTLTWASGTVAGFAESDNGVAMAKTEADLLPGSSGGPVVDEDGRLVGVISTAYTDAHSQGRLSYFVLESEARALVELGRSLDPPERDLSEILAQAERVIQERR